MSRPQTRTDDEILAAARTIYLERGPTAPMSAIAAAVGLSQPALSHRFGSRDALLVRALVPTSVPGWLQRLAEPIPDHDARGQLQRLAAEGLQVMAEAVPCLATIRASAIDVAALFPGVVPPHARVLQAVIDWFRRAAGCGGIAPGDPTARATVFLGTRQAHALHAWVSRAPLDRAAAEQAAIGLVDAMWQGLRPGSGVG